jgi:hypothetical protein
MNRIRKMGKKYQVLCTPNHEYDSDIEFLLGTWSDSDICGFAVIEFNNFVEAKFEADKFPDINWTKIVQFHKDNFYHLRDIVKITIEDTGMIVGFYPKLMSPEEAKHIMFERIISFQKSDMEFRMLDGMNDIISYTITNPWVKNLREIIKILFNNIELRLFKKIEKNNMFHLIGKTHIGTTYEIILYPDLIYNWVQWQNNNTWLHENQKDKSLKKVIELQKIIDNSFRLR